jgi:hypothetical protein
VDIAEMLEDWYGLPLTTGNAGAMAAQVAWRDLLADHAKLPPFQWMEQLMGEIRSL